MVGLCRRMNLAATFVWVQNARKDIGSMKPNNNRIKKEKGQLINKRTVLSE